MTLGDVDGDGDLDALVSSPASDDGEPPHVWLNSADLLMPQDDSYAVLEDSANSFDVRVNDAAFNTEALSVVAVSPAANGATALSGTTAVSYTPAVDFNGTDAFTYTVTASGSQTGTAAVTVTVSPVNDPPHFTLGADPAVVEDDGAQVLAGWATDIRPGPVTAVDEASQALTFTLTNDNVALFVQQPVLNTSGVLSFTSAADAHGSAVVTATLQDSGGTVDGGLDTTDTHLHHHRDACQRRAGGAGRGAIHGDERAADPRPRPDLRQRRGWRPPHHQRREHARQRHGVHGWGVHDLYAYAWVCRHRRLHLHGARSRRADGYGDYYGDRGRHQRSTRRYRR